MGVNEDYRLLWRETTWLANVLKNTVPPFSGSQGVRLLVSSLLQPKMEGSSPDTTVSPLMPTTSCQQTEPYLRMLSNRHVH